MRRAKEMAAEAADRIKLNPSLPNITEIVTQYFKETQESLKESQAKKPAVEQVPHIFKEADDRWLGFCNRLEKNFPQIILDREAFVNWANAERDQCPLVVLRLPLVTIQYAPDRAHFCKKDPGTGASYWYEEEPRLSGGHWNLKNPGWYMCASLDPKFVPGV